MDELLCRIVEVIWALKDYHTTIRLFDSQVSINESNRYMSHHVIHECLACNHFCNFRKNEIAIFQGILSKSHLDRLL